MTRMLHIAAVTQIRHGPEGKAHYRRKRAAAGKMRPEAMRCLKRRLSVTGERIGVGRIPDVEPTALPSG